MTKTFQYFVKYDRQDSVQIGVVIDVGSDFPSSTVVIQGSDSALTDAAVASGKSTWDEDTICEVHGLSRAPVVAIVATEPVA